MAVHFYTVSAGNALAQMCGFAIYGNPAGANPSSLFPDANRARERRAPSAAFALQALRRYAARRGPSLKKDLERSLSLRSSRVPEGAFLESTVLGPVLPIAGDLGLVMTRGHLRVGRDKGRRKCREYGSLILLRLGRSHFVCALGYLTIGISDFFMFALIIIFFAADLVPLIFGIINNA